MKDRKSHLPKVKVEELAAVLEGAAYEQLDERVDEIDLEPLAFEDFFTSLSSESNRAIAVVTYSFIDDRMRALFLGSLNPRIHGGPKRLFENIGPLGTSSARIELAAALFWISSKTYKNINFLRKIRNEFAHNPYVDDFSSGRVGGLLSSMDPYEDVWIQYLRDFLPTGFQPNFRLRFILRSIIACQDMMIELATSPIAQRMGLHSQAALRRPFDQSPSQIRDLARSASSAGLRFLEPEFIREIEEN